MTKWLHFHFSLSCIGEGNGNPLQCSCLENPRDGGAWWAAVYGVTQSWTRLNWLSSSNPSSGLRGSYVGIPTIDLHTQPLLWLCSHSVMSDSATPWIAARQASLSFTIFQSFLKLMFIEPVILSNQLILCRPLLLMPSVFPRIGVFSYESALRIGWPKYWSFSFSIRPSNEYSGLISFRIDWFDLLAVQGTLKSPVSLF